MKPALASPGGGGQVLAAGQVGGTEHTQEVINTAEKSRDYPLMAALAMCACSKKATGV